MSKASNRIKARELLVCPTDKTGKLMITTLNAYLCMGEPHTSKDKEISIREVQETQQILNGHQSCLNKAFNIGKTWGHQDRVRESTISQSNSIPPMYLMVKDHKKVEEDKYPKTRPVVSNCRGMGSPLSNTMSDLVESLATAMESSFESCSTEDYLAKTDKYNAQIKSNPPNFTHPTPPQEALATPLTGKVTPPTPTQIPRVGSPVVPTKAKVGTQAAKPANPPCPPLPTHPTKLPTPPKTVKDNLLFLGADVETMFPSLEAEQVAKLVADEFMRTKFDVDEVNYKQLGIYIALNWSPGKIRIEGLHRVCPRRKYNKGPKPTIHGKEAKGGKSDEGDSKWEFEGNEPNEWEKKKLVASAIQIGIIASFKHHVYCFGGRAFR